MSSSSVPKNPPPLKQLVVAFSPDNESGFKRVVMLEEPGRGYVLGFLTREFTVDRGRGAEAMLTGPLS